VKLHLWFIKFIGLIVPRRLRTDWRQEWEAELHYRETLLAEWENLTWRTKLALLWHSLGAFADALWLQPKRWEDEMFQDLRYGVRTLRKHKRFTLVAVISLALGIAATTTVFSFITATILRPAPVRDAANLYDLDLDFLASYPDYLDYRSRTDVFSDLIASRYLPASLNHNGEPAQVNSGFVTGNYFSVLGVQPALGRFFTRDEDRTPGAHPVVVLGFALWQRRFGADPAIIGQTVRLNRQPHTVIGVAPREFTGIHEYDSAQLYVPLMMQAQLLAEPDAFTSRGVRGLYLTGRLNPGVTRQQAEAAVRLLDQQLRTLGPPRDPAAPRYEASLAPILSVRTRNLPRMLLNLGVLFAIPGSVLLIAGANVAGMLLARGAGRRGEIAVRVAVGATRVRLLRQLLTESVLLFLLAGALGAMLSVWLTRIVAALPFPEDAIFPQYMRTDWRVLCFTLLLALLTGVIFGLTPALAASRVDVHTVLKDAPGPGAWRPARLRQWFVIGQIAVALVLATNALWFMRLLQYSQRHSPARQPETLLTAHINWPEGTYDDARKKIFFQQLTESVAALPDAKSVSLARELHWSGFQGTTEMTINGASGVKAGVNSVTPRYFQTLGQALQYGRDFSTADQAGASPVVIINEACARLYGPGATALGQQMTHPEDRELDGATIIGIVENEPPSLFAEAARPFVYMPIRQFASETMLLVRQRGETANLAAAVRQIVQTLEPELPLKMPVTLAESARAESAPFRAVFLSLNALGLLGLALAALGIYGLVAYTVSQRTHEIGLRVALGAQRRDIIQLVLWQGLKLGLLGGTLGLALAFVVGRVLTSNLFGLKTNDPMPYLGMALLLILVTLIASFLPARRAAGLDPLTTLRHE
jgi:putative ABC transport system permease protein